ncbi:hypothetical protein EBZ39_19750 [bacterium]|jgi:hypothetical protein|nr:hypothetical protein [bacterium]
MEGVGGFIYCLLAVAAFFLLVLLLLLPVFVFQISNSSLRSEALLKKAVAELEKINAHLTPPPPQE